VRAPSQSSSRGRVPDAPSIQGTVDAFRANNGNAPGPLFTGRREINWDGGGQATTISPTPFNGFQNIRGALFTTSGTGFVQAPPSGLATTFNNPTYSTFSTFSDPRLFTPIGSTLTNVAFFVPGTNGGVPATLHRRTYERLCNEAEKAELPYQRRVMTRLQGLLEKSGLLPPIESDHPDQEQVEKAVQLALDRPALLKQARRARRRGRTKKRRSPGYLVRGAGVDHLSGAARDEGGCLTVLDPPDPEE
jgi:hypothetical protein